MSPQSFDTSKPPLTAKFMQAMASEAAQHDSSLRDASAHVGQHALDLGKQIARKKGVEKVQTHLEFANPAREILRMPNSQKPTRSSSAEMDIEPAKIVHWGALLIRLFTVPSARASQLVDLPANPMAIRLVLFPRARAVVDQLAGPESIQ